MIPYSRCSRDFETDLQDFPVPVFSKKIKVVAVQHFEIHRIIFRENDFGVVMIYFMYLGVLKDKRNWFWGSGTRPEMPKS